MSTASNLPPLGSKGIFSVTASITIDAPIEKVWSILLDFPSYHEWNPFVRGQTIVDDDCNPLPDQTPLTGQNLFISPIHIPPSMTVPPSSSQIYSSHEIITAVDVTNQRLAWRFDGPPRWVLDCERWQALSLTGDGRTRYETVEVFRGVGAYAVKWWMGKGLQEGFRAMAEGLKRRAED